MIIVQTKDIIIWTKAIKNWNLNLTENYCITIQLSIQKKTYQLDQVPIPYCWYTVAHFQPLNLALRHISQKSF